MTDGSRLCRGRGPTTTDRFCASSPGGAGPLAHAIQVKALKVSGWPLVLSRCHTPVKLIAAEALFAPRGPQFEPDTIRGAFEMDDFVRPGIASSGADAPPVRPFRVEDASPHLRARPANERPLDDRLPLQDTRLRMGKLGTCALICVVLGWAGSLAAGRS
jgi:hypothetical protein